MVIAAKDMAITRAEFLRILPRFLGSVDFTSKNDRIVWAEPDRHLTIELKERPDHRLGSLSLPMLRVTLSFDGYPNAEIDDCLQRFDRTYRRGGG